MPNLTVSSDVDDLMQAADFAAFRSTLGLGALSTVTPGANVATALAIAVGSAGGLVVINGAGGTPSSITLTNGTGLPISTGVSGLGANVATFLATPSSANLAAAVTGETGSGALVFATSPTLVTPALGTPSALVLTNATGLPVSTGISGLGTNVATALGIAIGSAGAVVVLNGAGGTPSSLTLTNATGLPVGGISASGTPGATTFLRGDGSWQTPSGTGDVVGPASSTDNAIVAFDGATGKLIQNTAATIDPATGDITVGDVTGGALVVTSATPVSNDGAALGSNVLSWSDLFLASGAVTNYDNGNVGVTHSSGVLTVNPGDFRVTTAGTNTASVVTVGGTQTLSAKTFVAPALGTPASGTLTNCTGLPVSGLAAGTLGALMTLGEGAGNIALDPALSADGAYSGIVMTGTSGYTQAFGDVVYLDPTDSRWEACDANAASGADGDCRGSVGMVVVAGTDGNSCTILIRGKIRADANFPAFTINNPIYISETAGDVTQTQPTTTDAVIRIIGWALTADEMMFAPDNMWITHT